MCNVVYVYLKDGIVKALDHEEALKESKSLVALGWKHTFTLSPSTWFNYYLNCDNKTMLDEIKSLKK